MQVGDPDGHGRYGYIDGDHTRLLCHECGEYFQSLGSHAAIAHGMTADEYREEHSIPRHIPLVSDDVGDRISTHSRERIGDAGWKNFESKRDPTAASHARSKESFIRRGVERERHREIAIQNIAGARKPRRPCEVCGRPPSKAQLNVPTCGEVCARIHRYRTWGSGPTVTRWAEMLDAGESKSSIGRQYGCSHTNVRVKVNRWMEHMDDIRVLISEVPGVTLEAWERDSL